MKCKYCDAEIIEGSRFCRMCGQKVETVEEQSNEEIIWNDTDNNADSAENDSFGFSFPNVMDFSDGDYNYNGDDQIKSDNGGHQAGFYFDDIAENSESCIPEKNNVANTLWKQRVKLSGEIRLEQVKATVSVSKEESKKGSDRIKFAVFERKQYSSEKQFAFSPEFKVEKFLNAWIYQNMVLMIGSNKVYSTSYLSNNNEIFLCSVKYNGNKAKKCMDSITVSGQPHSYNDLSFEMYRATDDPDRILFVDENRKVFIIYNIKKKKSEVILLDNPNKKADFRLFENGILINGNIVYQDGVAYGLKDMIDTERAGNGLMKYIFEDLFIEPGKVLSEYYLNEQWLKDFCGRPGNHQGTASHR